MFSVCSADTKYRATINKSYDSVDGKKKLTVLGYYETPQEAYEVYKQHKRAEIIYIADSYKNVIPDKLYQAMINWKFDEYKFIKNIEQAAG